jgi:hypothetical protein
MQNARQMATETDNASRGLPADLLESKGINATAIQTLKERAGELGGPQVAAIARGIAGPGAAPGDRVPENANRGQAPDRNATAEDNTTATTTPSGQTADSDTPDNRTADGDAESTRGGR